MDELRNYNKEDMTPERRKNLKRYVEDENMSVDRLRKVGCLLVLSKLAGFFMCWLYYYPEVSY